jgi:hypothetical protein
MYGLQLQRKGQSIFVSEHRAIAGCATWEQVGEAIDRWREREWEQNRMGLLAMRQLVQDYEGDDTEGGAAVRALVELWRQQWGFDDAQGLLDEIASMLTEYATGDHALAQTEAAATMKVYCLRRGEEFCIYKNDEGTFNLAYVGDPKISLGDFASRAAAEAKIAEYDPRVEIVFADDERFDSRAATMEGGHE